MAKKGFLPLVLSVKAANWRMNDENSEEADTEFRHVRQQALERDKRTCQFCGFKAVKYQEVHHLNDDHADNRQENLVTACGFCHQVQHIGLAGKNKEAVLVWLPEVSQDKLHHLVRSILVATKWAEGVEKNKASRREVTRAAIQIAEAAKSLEGKFKARTADAEKHFMTSDPSELGNILHQMGVEQPVLYDRRADFLTGLRLLPLGKRMQNGKDTMPDIINSWTEPGGPYTGVRPTTWVTLLTNAAR
jgi:intracellular multiplication protein IcmJ